MRMSKATLILIPVLLAAALAGCGGPAPTPTRIAEVATDTPAPSATSSHTPTPAPSATETPSPTSTPMSTPTVTVTSTPSPTATPVSPLSIEVERQKAYAGSDIVIEETLAPGANYTRYVASYLSDGLKIYALLTVPSGTKPANGWPVIVFNHGYIPPAQYRTTERYVAYVDSLARAGYIVFKSDYRGHGSSEGQPSGGYGTPDYTTDVLNALGSLKRFPDADPNRIGMWGHSMGGQATLRAMVVSPEIKAGVIWAGVVSDYPDIMYRWHARTATPPAAGPAAAPTVRPTGQPTGTAGSSRRWSQNLTVLYGSPEQNPAFWAAISPNSYLKEISGPLQLHHGTADTSVPLFMSEDLYAQMKEAGQTAEMYTYAGDDHNIAASFATAMGRSIAFFDKWVKGPSEK